MRRRAVLKASALGLLARPALAQPASARVLKFIPAAARLVWTRIAGGALSAHETGPDEKVSTL